MSVAISGIVIGRCKIVIAANGCKVCGVEFSEVWYEQKVPIVVAGKRYFLMVPICAACAPHRTAPAAQPNETTFPPYSEDYGHL